MRAFETTHVELAKAACLACARTPNTPPLIDSYREERECVFRGERYSVRDNGAVMRHANPAKRPRPTDGVWTFGYCAGAGMANAVTPQVTFHHPVNRIVAVAFLGAQPSPEHVVTHLDGDIENNCVENLRWETWSSAIGRRKNRERLAKIAAYRAQHPDFVTSH